MSVQESTDDSFARPKPAVNLRLSVPSLSGRLYVNILAGREKRSENRLAEERVEHPLRTTGNTIFLFAIGAICGIGGLLLMLDGALFLLRVLGLSTP